jgi:hypothetical protein
MMGLPRSGKSTWAKKTGFPIVNRDAIRLAVHGQPYIQVAESAVTMIEDYMVRALFNAGHDVVIVDATHLRKKYRDRWADGPWKLEIQLCGANKEQCMGRAIRDGRDDLLPIIKSMNDTIEFG